jgi:hypothetical protein
VILTCLASLVQGNKNLNGGHNLFPDANKLTPEHKRLRYVTTRVEGY